MQNTKTSPGAPTVKQPVMTVTTWLHLVLRWRISGAIPFLPPYAFTACIKISYFVPRNYELFPTYVLFATQPLQDTRKAQNEKSEVPTALLMKLLFFWDPIAYRLVYT